MGLPKLQIFKAYMSLLLVVFCCSNVLWYVLLAWCLGYGLLQLMMQLIPQLNVPFSAFAMLLGPLPIALFTSATVLLGFVLPQALAIPQRHRLYV